MHFIFRLFIFVLLLFSYSISAQCSYHILQTDASHSSASDAMATAVPTHAYQYPIDYSWSTGDTTDVLVGVGVGTYTLTLTDASGCVQIIPITIQVGNKTRDFMIASGRDLLDESFLLDIDVDSAYCSSVIPRFMCFGYAIGVDTSDAFDFSIDFGDGHTRTKSRKGTLGTLSNARYQYLVQFVKHEYAIRQNYDVRYSMTDGQDTVDLLREDEIVFKPDDCDNCLGHILITAFQPPDPSGSNQGSFIFSLVNVTPYYWVFNPYIPGVYISGIHSAIPVDTSFGIQTPLFQPSGIPADSVFIYYYDFFTGCYGDTTFYFGTDLSNHDVRSDEFVVFPNPAVERFSIKWAREVEIRKVVLQSISGERLANYNIENGSNSISIPRDDSWSEGLYVLWLESADGERYFRKIVLQ